MSCSSAFLSWALSKQYCYKSMTSYLLFIFSSYSNLSKAYSLVKASSSMYLSLSLILASYSSLNFFSASLCLINSRFLSLFNKNFCRSISLSYSSSFFHQSFNIAFSCSVNSFSCYLVKNLVSFYHSNTAIVPCINFFFSSISFLSLSSFFAQSNFHSQAQMNSSSIYY